MATIDLTDAEVLGFSQSANYIDDNYQFGKTVSLSITAFIKPPNGSVNSRFQQITNKEKQRLEEIQASGFVDNISINGEIIQNVKILSFDFPTREASITDHIQLLRVNMNLEFYEAIDNTSNLKAADEELYKATDFLQTAYARYFVNFSESFSFSISELNEYSFNQSINFKLRKDTPTDIDFSTIVKEIVLKAFNNTGNSVAKVGFIDDRYANFIRVVKANGVFSESHDALNNVYTIQRAVTLKNGAYRSTQKEEEWSAEFTHNIAVEPTGSVLITENGVVNGRSNIDLESDLSSRDEKKYENAFQGYKVVKAEAYARCQELLNDLIKSSSSWIPGDTEWSNSPSLKERYVSLGFSVNRQSGEVGYNITFTNNPRMHADAIFEYSLEASRDAQNITSVTESGSITPYDKNKFGDFNPKPLYDLFTASTDVIDRMNPIFNSLKVSSSIAKFVFPTNLTASTISFNASGVGISYSFTYQDDPTLRNGTYLRKIEKSEDYNFPVAISSNVVAPNLKESHYDANQSTEGSKNISFDCTFKRNPSSNIINSSHIDYLKTSSSSLKDLIKQEIQKSAFVNGKQVAKNDLSWYPQDMNYTVGSDYSFNLGVSMNFVDKKGVSPLSLKYL